MVIFMVVKFGYLVTIIFMTRVFLGRKVNVEFGEPFTTHCYLLPLLSQCMSLEEEIIL